MNPMTLEGDFRLGDWVVQPHANIVVGPEGDARVEPRAMQVLALLAGRAGDVVSKEEILGDVWEGAEVTDEVLANAIWELRKALGDDAKRPRFIQTLPRKGYRLIAPVSPADAPIDGGVRRRWRWTAAAAAVLLTLAGAVTLWHSRGLRPTAATAASEYSVAVVNFENQTGSEDHEWLTTGVPTMIRTGLAEVAGVRVVPGSFQAGVAEWRDLARQAGADAVILGTIFQHGREYRIDVQVERLADRRIVSGHSVRGQDVFSLIDELTGRVLRGLHVGPDPSAEPLQPLEEMTTASLEAFRLYNAGTEARRHLRLEDARRDLTEAVRIDPGFALAYLELEGIAHVSRDDRAYEEYRQKTLEHLNRLPPHKQALQDADELWKSDPEKAIVLLEDVIERFPDEEDAYLKLSHLYRDRHRTAESLAVLERGVAAVPHSGFLRLYYGYGLLWEGRYPEAIHQFETYARINPEEANPWDSLGEAYLIAGIPERALENYERSLEMDSDFSSSRLGQAWALGQMGRFDEALRALDSIGTTMPPGYARTDLALHRAYLLSRGGRYREAEAILAEVEKAAAGKGDAFLELPVRIFRSLLAIERGDARLALGMLEAASSTAKAKTGIPTAGTASRRLEALSRLLGGVAACRVRDLPRARLFLARLGEVHDEKDPLERWWYHLLLGELALAEGNPTAAYSAFEQGQPRKKLPFSVNALLGNLGGSLIFRDGAARARALEGDLRSAADLYRKLLRPDIGHKWTAVVEPRFHLELARLERTAGRGGEAAKHYRDFLELWSRADGNLAEIAEAETYLKSS